MALYTFVLEYDGGTYVSQVLAASKDEAPAAWAASLWPGQVRGMRETNLLELRSGITSHSPVPLDGLVNAWCASCLVRGRLALVNVFETAPAATGSRP